LEGIFFSDKKNYFVKNNVKMAYITLYATSFCFESPDRPL